MEGRRQWKVVALRNGVAESLLISADMAEVMTGTLMLLNSEACGRLETVHTFAAGHWTEVMPAPLKGPENG